MELSGLRPKAVSIVVACLLLGESDETEAMSQASTKTFVFRITRVSASDLLFHSGKRCILPSCLIPILWK